MRKKKSNPSAKKGTKKNTLFERLFPDDSEEESEEQYITENQRRQSSSSSALPPGQKIYDPDSSQSEKFIHKFQQLPFQEKESECEGQLHLNQKVKQQIKMDDLDYQIEAIIKANLLDVEVSPKIVKAARQILLNQIHKFVHKCTLKAIMRNSKANSISLTDILPIVSEMGEVYRTKVAKTLLYERFREGNKIDEPETSLPLDIPSKKQASSRQRKQKEKPSLTPIKEEAIFESD